ncbi:DUF421 domain-containing protein [Kaistella sp. 97-N-M2]|uniref:DUF421 domain-containing protein n=1 Tax=Kaistella sp. 97-N-M2 TaxID=2908645 RepID=UPI001F24036A|nr:YetF domain-containing protein [Kaistella sp. 97-N-M2]UJF30757.1 DUF421 domain-containing protein [Kaistella sp. 97-N-M2]
MEYTFFESWDGILRITVTTILAYIVVIIMLRISGKRTLAKMNAFDFIVTIALGSILSSLILSKDTPLAEGLLAIALLIALQYCFTYISLRSKKFKDLISNDPVLLFYKGHFFKKVLREERVSQQHINKSVREAGFPNLDKIEAIVLEPTGDITVISKNENGQGARALSGIENFPRD